MRTWLKCAAALAVVACLGGGAAAVAAPVGDEADEACADTIMTPDGEAVLIATDELEETLWVPYWWNPWMFPIELMEFERVMEIGYYRLDGELIVIRCDMTFRLVSMD